MTEPLQVRSGPVALHVEVDGPADAPAVLFLHGIASSARNWAWLPAELVAGRRIIRMDLRGHGRSGWAPGTYDLPHYGADAVAALASCARGPAVLVGRSVGGTVAWWVAQHRPDLVAAVLLEDPALYVECQSSSEAARTREIFRSLRSRIAADRESRLSEAEVIRELGARPWGPEGLPLAQAQHEDAVAAVGFGHARVDLGVIDAMIEGTALAALRSEMRVAAPARIIAADASRGGVFTSAHERRLSSDHSQVRVIRLAGCGHGLHDLREGRDVFCRHLAEFLNDHAGPARGVG